MALGARSNQSHQLRKISRHIVVAMGSKKEGMEIVTIFALTATDQANYGQHNQLRPFLDIVGIENCMKISIPLYLPLVLI
jgi:hypothetical protein